MDREVGLFLISLIVSVEVNDHERRRNRMRLSFFVSVIDLAGWVKRRDHLIIIIICSVLNVAVLPLFLSPAHEVYFATCLEDIYFLYLFSGMIC